MPRLSYRNRIILKKVLRIGLIVLIALLICAILLLIYLEPYMVYDREGAHLVMEEEVPVQTQEVTETRPVITDPKIVYGNTVVKETNLVDMENYYITTDMLQDAEKVLDAVKELEGPCAIMVQMKSSYGNFYYDTKIKGVSIADVDTKTIAKLISYLDKGNFYLIAEVPAFNDTAYALSHNSCGLPMDGGILWSDENYHYWLDPSDTAVINYLKEIGQELYSMGFDEIAFSDFWIPDDEDINYGTEMTPAEILAASAKQVTEVFTEAGMLVSFVSSDLSFPISECNGRFYVPELSGAEVEPYVQNFSSAKNLKEIVFLSASKDSRFENKAVMRPLLAESE